MSKKEHTEDKILKRSYNQIQSKHPKLYQC